MNDNTKQRIDDYFLIMALEGQLDQDEEMIKFDENVVPYHKFSEAHEDKMRKLFMNAVKY